MKYFFCTIFLLLVTSLVFPVVTYSQSSKYSSSAPSIEELPRRPMDTIKTQDPETRVIIFSNNTWEFYRPVLPERIKNAEVYKINWDTSSVFSYRNIELSHLPEVVNLHLVDNLDEFCSPTRGNVISKYGPRRRRNHNGVDIPLKVGEPLFAAFEGKVRYAKYNTGGFGNLVIIRHPNGLETWYAHQSKLNCSVGDYVKAGQVIGYGGSTGRSFGPHLHFEMRYQDQTFDPDFLIDFPSGQLKYQTFALQKRYFNIHSRASEILEEDDYEEVLAAGSIVGAADDSTAIRVVEAKPKTASQPVYYKIRSGDNLGKIAIKHGTTVENLCRLNKITRTTTLQINRSLRVK